MSGFIDKIKETAEAVSAAIDNELTVLEGAGGDDVLAHHDDEATDDATANGATGSADTENGATAS